MALKISQMVAAGALTGDELVEVSAPSATVTLTATTISAQASDNSYNHSGSGFLAAGFLVGDSVRVQGFTGDAVNNIFSGRVTVLTAGKMIIGGADGDVIVDDAAGESVTITRWDTRRTTSGALAGGATAPSVQSVVSASTVTPTSTDDLVVVTAQAAALTVANPSGTPSNGWGLVIRIKDNGTSRAITWGSDYQAIGVALPASTVAGKQHYIGCVYNGADAKWDVLSVAVQS